MRLSHTQACLDAQDKGIACILHTGSGPERDGQMTKMSSNATRHTDRILVRQ